EAAVRIPPAPLHESIWDRGVSEAAPPVLTQLVTVRARPIPLRHRSSSGQDSAPVLRQRGFESHPVLSRFALWQFSKRFRTHDVAAACRLARAEVRVQFPLGAFSFAWNVCSEGNVDPRWTKISV